MKKCPFCAEEIQDDAIICKHCKSSLVKHEIRPAKKLKSFKMEASPSGKKALKVVLIILLVGVCILTWFLSIPILIIWYLWKKSKLTKKNKIYITIGISVLYFFGLVGFSAYTQAATLTITSPSDQANVSSTTAQIMGKVEPKDSTLEINKQKVLINTDGSFIYNLALPQPDLKIDIVANHHGSVTEKTLVVHRQPTPEETTAEAAQAAAQKEADAQQAAAAAKAAAKAKADEAVWNNSRAGRICAKHKDWTKDTCQQLANNKIWIGMSMDMVVAEMGKPNDVNTSNYGSGVQYQYCYTDGRFMCFYAGEDGIVTSYN